MNTNAASNPQILRLILRSSRRGLPQQRCSCIRLHLRTGPRYAMAASVLHFAHHEGVSITEYL